MRLPLRLLLAAPFLASLAPSAFAAEEPFPVTIRVDAAQPIGALKPIWRFFGCDEPNYASMKDGRKLIGELGELAPKSVYFRTHNLLNTGDGTPALKWGSTNVYTEDAQGRPVYNWTIIDHLFDTYLARGVRPYAQIGFMPQALSSKPEPYQHEWRPGEAYDLISTGWAYPPKDYAKWEELAYQWVKHCVEKYGRAEVEQWYWEVWNEANGASYWHGGSTPDTNVQEFCKLHDYAIAGVRRALPTARVGGLDAAGTGGPFTTAFLEHCLRGTNYATGQKGTPLDFVSFHAKGSPSYVAGHVRMGISNQLRTLNDGFAMIAAHPELKKTPIIIGESDPDGCAACTASVYPQNNYRNGTLYASYTAATFGRELALADKHGVNLEGALTWAFEFEDQPYFAGFRVLATNGIDLPVLNVFRMMSRMAGQRVAVTSSAEVPLDAIMRSGVRGATADVAALASLDTKSFAVLVWHYHDDDVPGPDAAIELAVAGLPAIAANAKLTHYRIDQEHSNAFTAWQRMGAPTGPKFDQYQQLVAAGQLALLENTPATAAVENGAAMLKFTLPRQAVSLLVLTW
jgi:xylan 1,4-beta-xylosidase